MICGLSPALAWYIELANPRAGTVAAPDAAVHAEDAKAVWVASGRPVDGVHEAQDWIFSGHRQVVDPDSEGFESVEMNACKQMAMDQLVRHCAGEGKFDSRLAAPLNALVDSEMWLWYSGKLDTSGSLWVESRRTGNHDVAVLALPIERCRAMPKRARWRDHLIDVARESQNWLAVAVVAESAGSEQKDELAELISARLRAATAKPGPAWPAAFVKVPNQLRPEATRSLGLGELARLAAIRPGDRSLWDSLAQRCADAGLMAGAESVRQAPTTLGWPRPALIEGSAAWSSVPVGDFPPALVAVIRSGGSIPATQGPPSEASRLASKAFFAKDPDLNLAESKAKEACATPNADALNLLAAIRLSRPDADEAALLQALALSSQASAVDPAHPFARVNALRAMQRLGWRESTQSAIEDLPQFPEGSWQRRQIDAIQEWLSAK